MTVRALIVDDEAVARRGIRQHLRSETDIEVVAESEDGASAIAAIAELKPDLVFLDLQMPGIGGFEVVESVGLSRMPAVIFVTAYVQFSLRAFDVHAVDYVLKPIDPTRFATAIQRARRRLGSMDPLGERIAAVLKDLNRSPPSAWSPGSPWGGRCAPGSRSDRVSATRPWTPPSMPWPRSTGSRRPASS